MLQITQMCDLCIAKEDRDIKQQISLCKFPFHFYHPTEDCHFDITNISDLRTMIYTGRKSCDQSIQNQTCADLLDIFYFNCMYRPKIYTYLNYVSEFKSKLCTVYNHIIQSFRTNTQETNEYLYCL